jgi:hypothetical protein
MHTTTKATPDHKLSNSKICHQILNLSGDTDQIAVCCGIKKQIQHGLFCYNLSIFNPTHEYKTKTEIQLPLNVTCRR